MEGPGKHRRRYKSYFSTLYLSSGRVDVQFSHFEDVMQVIKGNRINSTICYIGN